MPTSSWALITSLALGAGVAGCSQAPYPKSLSRPLAEETPAVWTRDLGRALETAPVVRGDRAYLTVTDETLVCLEVNTGREIWSKHLEGAPAGGPVLTDSTVVVATGYPKPHLQGFDAVSGDGLWSVRRRVSFCTALSQDRVALAGDDGLWEGVDARSGQVLWSRHLGARWSAGALSPAGTDTLWIPSDPDSLWMLDAGSGEVLGRAATLASPVLARLDSRLILIDAAGRLEVRREGDLAFIQSLDLHGSPAGPPVGRGDWAWVSLRDGRLVRLSTRDWAALGVIRFPSPLTSAPVLAGDALVQALPRGQVALLDARTGREQNRWQHPERVLAAPAVTPTLLLVPGSHGTLAAYALEPEP